ncbi:MAG: hypothetical protein QXD77_00065 [Candidatus Aenigmatarchaeota archaeon]
MAEQKIPWVALLAVVVGVALLLLFFAMQGRVFDAIKGPGRAIIGALNELMAGRPAWLK